MITVEEPCITGIQLETGTLALLQIESILVDMVLYIEEGIYSL